MMRLGVCTLCLGVWLFATLALAVPTGQTDGTKVTQFIPAPKKIALVIGINTYRHRHWGTLEFATRDALRFRQMLLRGGFTHVYQLTTPKETTLASIKRAMLALKRRNQSPGDTLVVYISAHGTLLESPRKGESRRYIVVQDTDDENVAKTGVSVRWLRAQIEGFLSRRKALILASCHTPKRGSKFKRVRGHKGSASAGIMPKSKTMLLLNAASYRYAAYESKKLRSDVYTHFLLDCIRKFRVARGKRAKVSAFEAHRCAVKQTYRYVLRHRGAEQLPGLVADVRGLNAVYFVGQPKQRKSVLGLPGDQGALVAKGERPVVQLPRRLLERYKVKIYRIDKKQRKQVDEFVHRGTMVATLQPGTYIFSMVSRDHKRQEQQTLTLHWGQRALLSPLRQHTHVISLSGGVAQAGGGLFQTWHPYTSIGYRQYVLPRLFLGASFSYLVGQPPQSAATFVLHRFGLLQLEAGAVLWSNDWVSLAAGLYGKLGLEHSVQPNDGRAASALSGGGGGLLDLSVWLHRHVGLRLEGQMGVDLSQVGTPVTTAISLAWRAGISALISW